MDHAAAVENAIKQFYTTGNRDVHQWLLQVQTSSEAWNFVWQLLDPLKAWEVQFFAATTLYTKISRYWHEVPNDQYAALKERVLNCIKQSDFPEIVLSKLCQALAALYANNKSLENGHTEEENSKSLVDELTEVLPYDTSSSLNILLRVLSALPEEFEKKQLSRGKKVGVSLASNWDKTVWILKEVFHLCNSQGRDNSLYFLALECTLSWLKYDQLPLDITSQIYSHLLIAASHYSPKGQNLNEDSREWKVVQECLSIVTTHSELYKRPQLLWEWLTNLVTVVDPQNGKYFCEVLASVGESHSRELLLALIREDGNIRKWTSERLIEFLLECSEARGRYPTEETRSCLTFGFWYTLQDQALMLDEHDERNVIVVLKPIYARLAQALLRKTILPVNEIEAGDLEERELFTRYRQDAADTLDYCYNILRDDLLILFGQKLSQPLNDVQKWAEVESVLHAFKVLAPNIGTEETRYVPELLNLILSNVPYDIYPKEVLACACSTMGAYAEWLGEQKIQPNPWMERILHLITLGLTQGPITAPLASMALKDICRECRSNITPYAPTLLNTIGTLLRSTSIAAREAIRLMYAAGKLLNSIENEEEQLMYLDAMLGVCISKTRQLLEQPVHVARSATVNQLKMISTFISTLESPRIQTTGTDTTTEETAKNIVTGTTILHGLLSIIEQIFSHSEWSQDDSTIAATYLCAQKLLGLMLHPEIDAKPLIPTILLSYRTRPHPSALQLLRSLALLFAKNSENDIVPIFADISRITLGGVNVCKTTGGNLSEFSELLESYMELLAQVCKKCVKLLLRIPDQIFDMLRCGIECLMLPENRTAKAAGSFLIHAIKQSSYLHSFIESVGQELICVILHCISGKVPRHNLEPHADVLAELNKSCLDWSSQWLRNAIESESVPNVTQIQKQTFLFKVLRERNNWRILDIIKDFSLQCYQQHMN